MGVRTKIEQLCISKRISIEDVSIIDPLFKSSSDEYSSVIAELVKKYKMTLEEVEEFVKDHLNFGCLMVRAGKADGMVGGAVRTTADTVRSAFRIIGLSDAFLGLSSCFIMEIDDKKIGHQGKFIYADCGVVVNPAPKQLANIAMASARSFKDIIEAEPRVAFILFLGDGSLPNENAYKINSAIDIIKSRDPGIKIDELSDISGGANIFIFPNLNAGNIAYKITERLAHARAIGPILQGLRSPVNDLSRGCTYEDIIDVTAVTILQAESMKTSGIEALCDKD